MRVQEVVIAGVGLLEVTHVNEVVDATLDIGHSRLSVDESLGAWVGDVWRVGEQSYPT